MNISEILEPIKSPPVRPAFPCPTIAVQAGILTGMNHSGRRNSDIKKELPKSGQLPFQTNNENKGIIIL
ncbi:MAG: hypothetical protein WD334_08925 [Chitinophagales bacterium]